MKFNPISKLLGLNRSQRSKKQGIQKAVLFADIANSSRYYGELGDAVAQSYIMHCLGLLADAAEMNHGVVIKTIGDEILCTFPTADNGVQAALAMHHMLGNSPIPAHPGIPRPNIYVGLHMGPVIEEEGDVFGDAVIVAARLEKMAEQRQTLTTKEIVQALSSERQVPIRYVDQIKVKGKIGEISVYEVIWEEDDVTFVLNVPADPQEHKVHMELRHKEHVITVDPQHPAATLGRQQHNDIVVNEKCVSRTHARIEYRRGKFVLIDQSSNGTYLIMPNKETLHIKRDDVPVEGSGVIGLGRRIKKKSVLAIHFNVLK